MISCSWIRNSNNYTIDNVLGSSSFNGSWHGSHVAGTAAGNQFGAAFQANIWSIACIDRTDVGFSNAADGFDYIRVWHKNKPVNPVTGRKNPTIVNGSWGYRQFVIGNNPTGAIMQLSGEHHILERIFYPVIVFFQQFIIWIYFNI